MQRARSRELTLLDQRETSFKLAMVAACPFPWPRGTPARVLGLATAMARAGHEVHVIAYGLGTAAIELPFQVHRIARIPGYQRTAPGPDPVKLGLLDPLLARRVLQVVQRHGIEIVHAHHYEGLLAALPARRRAGVPVVYDAHTMLGPELPSYSRLMPRRLLRRAGHWLDQRLPALADHTVATTEQIGSQLVAAGLPTAQVSVIGNGIEDEVVDAISQMALPGRSPAAGPRVVYAGNLASYQGIETLLAAFANVVKALPEARLQFVTDTSFASYEALAAQLGIRDRIDLQALRTPLELPALLGEAYVLVNPRRECPGYPHKLLNYMAAGRPIVSFASSARGLRDGIDAWLVHGWEPEALAEGIVGVLERPALGAALGAAARARVCDELTWRRMAGQLEAVYADLLGRARSQDDRQSAGPRAPAVPTGDQVAPAEQCTDPISAVVVNYNGGGKVVRAVEALERHAPEIERIILVDNGSTDGSVPRLRARFPRLDIVELGDNLGLPSARNAGLRRATSGWVLLLDADVYVTPDSVTALLAAARRYRAAVVCPRIVLVPDGRTVQCDGAAPHFIGTLALLNARGDHNLPTVPAGPVGGCIGAAMLVDRGTVLDSGGFNELYFFYFEDLEFSLRMRLLGHEVVREPAAVVEHERGTGTPGLSFRGQSAYPARRAYLTMRNRLLTIALCYSNRSLLFLMPAFVVYEAATLAFAVSHGFAGQWWAAWAWLFRQRREIARQRRVLQRRRLRPDSKLLLAKQLPLAAGVAEGVFIRRLIAVLDRGLAGYWRVVARWV